MPLRIRRMKLSGEFSAYDVNDKIYRYMDFVKFSDLLSTGRLFFSRADQQNDKFEGQLGRVNILQRKFMPSPDAKTPTEEDFRRLQRSFLLTCWHRSSVESFAMWKMYATDNQGVAIETSIKDLEDSIIYKHEDKLKEIPHEEWGRDIYLSNCIHWGSVYYYDWENTSIPDQYVWEFRRFLCKLKNFEYEKEIRGIIDGQRLFASLDEKRKKGDFSKVISENGFLQVGESIPVDLNKMIGRVIICPAAPIWFSDLVKRTMEQYGIDAEKVNYSRLNVEPTF